MNSTEDDLIKNIWGRIEPNDPRGDSANVSFEVLRQVKRFKRRRWMYEFLGSAAVLVLSSGVVYWSDFSVYEGIGESFDLMHLNYFKLKMLVVQLFF